MLEARQPIVVYFPDSFFSNLSEASNWEQHVFLNKAKEMFNQLKGRVVLICGQNKREGGSEVMEKSVSVPGKIHISYKNKLMKEFYSLYSKNDF